MKYYLINILPLLICLTANSYAQDKPAASEGDLTFYMDYACFAGPDEKTTIEFYLMFFGDQIFVKGRDNSLLKITLTISDQDGKQILSTDWITEITNKDSSASDKVIYDKWAEEIYPGVYKVILTAALNGSKLSGKTTASFSVPSLDEAQFSSGTIKFLTVSADSPEDLKVNINPSRRYGILNPRLFFSYEIYGTDKEQLAADYSITDIDNVVQKSLNNIIVKKINDSFTVMHGIDVSTLASGLYKLNVEISDTILNTGFVTSRMFEIIQADFFENKPAITEEQADIFKTILEYIGNTNQMNIYESLDLNGKSQFMIKFWKSQDPVPGTEENEFLAEIQKRFNHAKNKFGWGKKNGWESDRGRICIKYGIPHQVSQYNNEANTNPYEIWTYNESKTYQFIFGDISSSGQYVLLHSNREGEIFNTRWREQIERM